MHREIEMERCTVLEPSSQNRMFFAFGPSTPLGPSEHGPDRGWTLYWWICSSRREATPPQRLVLPDTWREPQTFEVRIRLGMALRAHGSLKRCYEHGDSLPYWMNGTASPLSSQNRCVLLCTGTCHRCPVFCTRKLKWKAVQFWNHRRKTECSSHTVRVHPWAHRNTDLIEVGRFIGGSVAVGERRHPPQRLVLPDTLREPQTFEVRIRLGMALRAHGSLKGCYEHGDSLPYWNKIRVGQTKHQKISWFQLRSATVAYSSICLHFCS